MQNSLLKFYQLCNKLNLERLAKHLVVENATKEEFAAIMMCEIKHLTTNIDKMYKSGDIDDVEFFDLQGELVDIAVDLMNETYSRD